MTIRSDSSTSEHTRACTHAHVHARMHTCMSVPLTVCSSQLYLPLQAAQQGHLQHVSGQWRRPFPGRRLLVKGTVNLNESYFLVSYLLFVKTEILF